MNIKPVSYTHLGYIESFLETSNLKDYFSDFENNGRTGLEKGENIKLLIKRCV